MKAIWGALRYHGLILLPAMMFGALGGVGYAELQETTYSARADLFVTAVNDGTIAEAADAAAYSEAQAMNFAQLATRQIVLLPVIEELDLALSVPSLRSRVSASVPLDTSIISITTRDGSAQRSAELANAVAASLADVVADLSPSSSGGETPVQLQSIEEATPPGAPMAPRPLFNVVIGLLIGLFVGVAMIAVRDALVPPANARPSAARSGTRTARSSRRTEVSTPVDA